MNSQQHILAGLKAHQSGNIQAAYEQFQKALEKDNRNSDAWHLLGLLTLQSEPVKALDLICRALVLKPNTPQYLNSLGAAFESLNALEDALMAYDESIRLDPSLMEAHTNRGSVLTKLKRHNEAVRSLEDVLRTSPGFVNATMNLAYAYREKGDFGHALAIYEEALRRDPKSPDIIGNIGSTLVASGRLAEGAVRLEQALHSAPRHVQSLIDLGTARFQMSDLESAISLLEKAIAIAPNDVNAHWNMALALLTAGKFARGWAEYEWRFKRIDMRHAVLPGRPWTGAEPIEGHSITVHCEQGLGDSIQFSRFIPVLLEQGAAVVFRVQPALCNIMRSLGDVRIVSNDSCTVDSTEYHIPLMSLPLALGTSLETLPARVPYLAPCPELVSRWAHEMSVLSGADSRRVGLVWAGNPNTVIDRYRSIELQRLRPLLDISGVRFFSLQKEVPAQQLKTEGLTDLEIVNVNERIETIDDTAAILAGLDLLITVDTMVVHLAGALGRPTWLLASPINGWRWPLPQSNSPWYPQTRVFHRPALSDCREAVAAMVTALNDKTYGI